MSQALALSAPRSATRPRAALQRKCACGQPASSLGPRCEDCQRRQLFGIGPARRTEPAATADTGAGQPLDGKARSFFERRFGHGFGDVRIHADDRAAAAARALDAHAYTCGRDIVFARGRYAPASSAGQHLLAHELTHVVQQRAGLASVAYGGRDDPAEREAEHNAARLHTALPLRAVQRAPAVARQSAGTSTVTVEGPAGPPGCGLDQHHAIEPAVRGAQQRLARALARLDAYIAAPADAAQAPVRAALERHFHRSDAAVAGRVRGRLARIRTDMVSREPFTVECHDGTDAQCTNSGAYVQDRSKLVFCPPFFAGSPRWRIGTLVHEMAHSLSGLRITDRAYGNDRLLPYLSTAEAESNAESYEMFAEELESGRAVTGRPPQDEIDDCSTRTAPLVREAIARAQRWNRNAETLANSHGDALLASSAPLFTTHLGDALPATRAGARRVFGNTVNRLGASLSVRCESSPGAACHATRHAYKGSASNVGRGAAIGAGVGAGLGLVGGLIGIATGGIGLLAGLGLLALGGLFGAGLGALAGALTPSDEVRLCPSWATLPSVEDRTESLLAAVYETHAGLDAAAAARHAALARAIHHRWWPTPPAA